MRQILYFLYADDILLSPTVSELQKLVSISIRMCLNNGKSTCITFGPRFASECTPIVTANGLFYYHGLKFVNIWEYTWNALEHLDVHLMNLKVSF